MRLKIIVQPEAEAEAQDSFSWYESEKQGLGEEFFSQFRATLEAISHNPEQYPPIKRDIRRALLVRFPFAVFYVVQGDAVKVLAVFHSSRNPNEWRKRFG